MTAQSTNQDSDEKIDWLLVLGRTGIGLFAVLALIVTISAISNGGRFKGDIVQRFQAATPDPNIQIDASTEGNPGKDAGLLDGVEVVLFRSNAPTVKALIKRWDFGQQGVQKLDSFASDHFRERDFTRPAGGRYGALLHKDLPFYKCSAREFVPISYSHTYLFWDEATGTGCFYITWSD